MATGSTIDPGRIALHHIGSTAIAGLHAKPVIDMLEVATSLGALEAATPALTSLG